MKQKHLLRFSIITVMLVLGVFWALVSAKTVTSTAYPNASFIAKAQWLNSHINDPKLVIVDVRENKYLKDAFIPYQVVEEVRPERDVGHEVLAHRHDLAEHRDRVDLRERHRHAEHRHGRAPAPRPGQQHPPRG